MIVKGHTTLQFAPFPDNYDRIYQFLAVSIIAYRIAKRQTILISSTPQLLNHIIESP